MRTSQSQICMRPRLLGTLQSLTEVLHEYKLSLCSRIQYVASK